MKLRLLKMVAGICSAIALMDLGTLSIFTFHQPEIPEELR
jgi:cyclic lactone autoinducer peptide